MKVLGTLVPPGGLLAPLVLGLFAVRSTPLPPALRLSLLVVFVAAPVVVAIVLLRGASDAPAANGSRPVP